MSDTSTLQQGAGNAAPGHPAAGPQQQGQQPDAKPQQQSGSAPPRPIFKDWAAI